MRTQVVLAKFRTDSVKSTLPVKVRLSYYDVRRKCMVEEVQELRLMPAVSESGDLLADVEVKKNYTIAELADSLFVMTEFARRGKFSQAQTALDSSVATAYRRYPNMEDEDIKFILDIVEGCQRDLRFYNSHSRNLIAAVAARIVDLWRIGAEPEPRAKPVMNSVAPARQASPHIRRQSRGGNTF